MMLYSSNAFDRVKYCKLFAALFRASYFSNCVTASVIYVN